MKLYCFPCNEVHEFSETEHERLTYTLLAAYGDAAASADARPDALDAIPCLLDVDGWSWEPDSYREWTDDAVAARERLEAIP